MLTAAINKKTRMEMDAESSFGGGYDQGIAVAQASPGLRDGLPLFGYAADEPESGAMAAAAALAGGELVGPEIVNSAGEKLTLRLGSFSDPQQARDVSTAFAVLGAVDEASANGGTVLTLIRLKPGVERQDVMALARQLGLNDIVLY